MAKRRIENTITWTNERRALRDLAPWEHNPRYIKDAQAERLLESFNEFGQVLPICIGPSGQIYDGHQRRNVIGAADDYGLDYEIDVRVASRELTERERQKLTVYLHKGAAGDWDWEELANSFEFDDLVLWGFDEEQLLGLDFAPEEKEPADADPQIDRAEELRQLWGVETGQLWRIGEHRLIVGDCTDADVVARVMDGEKARMVFTSPPYPGADMWDDLGEVQRIEDIGLNCLELSNRVLKDGCPILWNIANTPIGTQAGVIHTTTTTTTQYAIGTLKLLCYGEIVWSKPVQHLTPLSFMMRPVVPNLIHEYVMVFYKGKRMQRENTSGLSDELKSLRTKSVWEIAPTSATSVHHKAPFPLELANNCIGLYSLECDLIYEPFAGSGTTLVACENLSRKCRAIEISPAYCAVILQRMREAFPEIEIEVAT